ncbi:MAG: hypothetical protein KDD47_28005, partial [Acidobacteria bacterium]|nr:hypothetical protein [Acidobacteriota bacterium]
MATTFLPVAVNGMPSQLGRRLAALEDGAAPVDGRSLAELLAFAPAFGALIHFYDLDDRIEGDWSEFYASDPALTLAAVATFDPKEGEGAFRRALGQAAG